MKKQKGIGFLITLFISFIVFTVSASGATLLKPGMRGNEVVKLQQDLKNLGYFPQSVNTTGYFGSITKDAVVRFQRDKGLKIDGIAGPQTFGAIQKAAPTSVSRQGVKNPYIQTWFGNAENTFPRGATAEVYDIRSGKTFQIKRTYGTNHADCETLTKEDTAIMKAIWGGEWSWSRRPVIITVNGVKLAASMAGFPHAGREDLKEGATASWRSGGYGEGYNLDMVKGNDMSGHFDVHFLLSRTHSTNQVNEAHQKAVQEAGTWALQNLK